MTDFIRRESKAQSIPALLESHVFGFKESIEYQRLKDNERTIPGVVCGAFARFLCRVHHENNAQVSGGDDNVKKSAHEALELMASSPEMENYVRDEIYENLDCEAVALEDFRRHLRQTALGLYETWFRENQ